MEVLFGSSALEVAMSASCWQFTKYAAYMLQCMAQKASGVQVWLFAIVIPQN